MDYWSTREVAIMENVTKSIATRWAKENSVRRVDTTFLWSKADLEAFKRRNKKRGRKV